MKYSPTCYQGPEVTSANILRTLHIATKKFPENLLSIQHLTKCPDQGTQIKHRLLIWHYICIRLIHWINIFHNTAHDMCNYHIHNNIISSDYTCCQNLSYNIYRRSLFVIYFHHFSYYLGYFSACKAWSVILASLLTFIRHSVMKIQC